MASTITAKALADALRAQESTGSSDPAITNKDSGAFGPWQIMPDNWEDWSAKAGIPGAARTLANQERVVMDQLQRHLDAGYGPADVAAIWYSGSPIGPNADAPQGDYPTIRQYAQSILRKLTGQTDTSEGPLKPKRPDYVAYNGRAPMADTTTTPGAKSSSSWSLGDIPRIAAGVGAKGTAAQKALDATTPKAVTVKPGATYTPTGVWETDTKHWFGEAQTAWGSLSDYLNSSERGMQVDDKNGVVYQLTGEMDDSGNPAVVVDPAATRLLRRALSAEQQLDLLYAGQKAGLYQSGADSAKAYLASETAKAADAETRYNGFISRIRDLVALDTVPLSRAATMASTMASVNTANKARKGWDTLASAPRVGPGEDMSPYIKAIKATLPEAAPGMYTIPQDAFNPTRPGAGSGGTTGTGAGGSAASAAASPGSVPMPRPETLLGGENADAMIPGPAQHQMTTVGASAPPLWNGNPFSGGTPWQAPTRIKKYDGPLGGLGNGLMNVLKWASGYDDKTDGGGN